MLDIEDFKKKQIIIFCPVKGDKVSYKNDNLIIKNDDKTKYQISCYRIFAVMIVGDCSVTTGILRRAKRYGFSICFFTMSFKYYAKFAAGLEGNTYLHQKQYCYTEDRIGQSIIYNKINNQIAALKLIRKKNDYVKEGISLLNKFKSELVVENKLSRATIMGIEGNASRVYFSRLYYDLNWCGRKPRIKSDYINCILDIGYTILFNFIDSLLDIYNFDTYKGVLHTAFYMRKSLVCDLMEPFRPIIDWRVRKAINLSQFDVNDFVEFKGQWQLSYKKSSAYVEVFMEDILKEKEAIFRYIRGYYRAFMKDKSVDLFPQYILFE